MAVRPTQGLVVSSSYTRADEFEFSLGVVDTGVGWSGSSRKANLLQLNLRCCV